VDFYGMGDEVYQEIHGAEDMALLLSAEQWLGHLAEAS
jgi:hypothetical protein